MDLFGFESPKRIKRLDVDSERFISLVHSIPIDDVRLIIETTWICFGEIQSRITVYGFGKIIVKYLCPANVAHRIMCRL